MTGYLPVSEAAKELHMNAEVLRRWVRRGKIPGYKIAGRVFIKREDLHLAIEPIKPREVK